ncbi:MAG: class I SAM-dependent methyltransferase [Gemmatimonadales bacterium]|nr:class I SAM-dependent methyltransferase [Gemmatimonadales bacterium]
MRTPQLPGAEQRAEARRVYGLDPVGYETGRPDYPARVLDVLTQRGLRPGSSVLEIGPGTGRVTRRLIDAGASVIAVEPDPALADLLRRELPADRLEVMTGTFEDAALPEDRFDLVIAAMAFHWVDQRIGLPRLSRVLRPGGWAAIWWTLFRDPSRPDPFADATTEVLGPPPGPVSGIPFELDVDAWSDSLAGPAGLIDVGSETIRWTARFDPISLRALYGSMISVRRRPEAYQRVLLDEIEHIATQDFGGEVERPFVTAIYTGRRPPTTHGRPPVR